MANKFLWRTNQLINLLPEDCDGALIMSQINGRYFTGFNCDNGYFIVTRGDCVYVTDSRYTEAARKAIGWCEVTEYAGPKMKECFGGIAAGLGLKKLLVESDRMTLSQYRMMSDVLTPAVLSEEGELDRLIESLRVHKDSDEIVCMRAAQNIAEQTLTHLFGMTSPLSLSFMRAVSARNGWRSIPSSLRARTAPCPTPSPDSAGSGAATSSPSTWAAWWTAITPI